MMQGKLEIIIKITELPLQSKIVGSISSLDCDGQIISLTAKPKVWNKLKPCTSQLYRMGGSDRNGVFLSADVEAILNKSD